MSGYTRNTGPDNDLKLLEVPMNRIAPLAGVALALAVVACANPGKDKPQAAVAPAPAEPAAAATAPAPQAQGAVYLIEPATSKIEWVGAKITLKHDGGFNSFKGTATLTGGIETAQLAVAIDTASIWSDNEKLTGHLKSPDFFNVEKFPKATFRSSGIVKSAAGDTYDVTGTLDLTGTRKQITFPATLALEGDVLKANAEFAINRKDFGIVYPGMPDDLIADNVLIKLSIAAKKQ
jgi:polyisoprenoid-binding protein YceI